MEINKFQTILNESQQQFDSLFQSASNLPNKISELFEESLKHQKILNITLNSEKIFFKIQRYYENQTNDDILTIIVYLEKYPLLKCLGTKISKKLLKNKKISIIGDGSYKRENFDFSKNPKSKSLKNNEIFTPKLNQQSKINKIENTGIFEEFQKWFNSKLN